MAGLPFLLALHIALLLLLPCSCQVLLPINRFFHPILVAICCSSYYFFAQFDLPAPLLLFQHFLMRWLCMQVGDSCSSARDCGAGLYCGNCAATGKTRPSCIRDLAIQPTSIVLILIASPPLQLLSCCATSFSHLTCSVVTSMLV
jgi:hypothetical protein